MFLPIRTDEILCYEKQVILIRCFVYPHVVRCGAAFISSYTPSVMPLDSLKGDRVARIRIPEMFVGKAESILMGDGGGTGVNAKPRMLEFDIEVV